MEKEILLRPTQDLTHSITIIANPGSYCSCKAFLVPPGRCWAPNLCFLFFWIMDEDTQAKRGFPVVWWGLVPERWHTFPLLSFRALSSGSQKWASMKHSCWAHSVSDSVVLRQNLMVFISSKSPRNLGDTPWEPLTLIHVAQCVSGPTDSLWDHSSWHISMVLSDTAFYWKRVIFIFNFLKNPFDHIKEKVSFWG